MLTLTSGKTFRNIVAGTDVRIWRCISYTCIQPIGLQFCNLTEAIKPCILTQYCNGSKNKNTPAGLICQLSQNMCHTFSKLHTCLNSLLQNQPPFMMTAVCILGYVVYIGFYTDLEVFKILVFNFKQIKLCSKFHPGNVWKSIGNNTIIPHHVST